MAAKTFRLAVKPNGNTCGRIRLEQSWIEILTPPNLA